MWGSTKPGHSGLDTELLSWPALPQEYRGHQGTKLLPQIQDLRDGENPLVPGRGADRKWVLSRAKVASSPTYTALSGPKKAWPVKGANLLTSQVGLAVPGSLVSPLLGAWLPEEELE